MYVNNYENKKEKGAKKPLIPNKYNEKFIYQKQRKYIKIYVSSAQSDHFLLNE